MGECNKLDHIDAIINEKEGLNRGQWYYISIKLKDFKGEPALAGWNVKFDEAIVFRDGRKIARENDVQTENVIIISLFGCCDSDGTTIKKCTKCADKDMNLIKKKRRNPMLTWNDNDDKNNSQFLQIIACDEVVSELGEIKFRLRFSCCIGVSKQPHINHRQIVNNIEQVGIHKNCAGLRMNAVIQVGESYKRVFVIDNISPIRVLGKVTNTTKKRKRDDENEMEEMDDLDDITKFDGNLNLMTRNINVDRNVDIYRFLQKKYCYDPGSILHKLTLAYHLKLGNLFPFPYQEIFSPEFFHKLNMNLLDPRSPLMLEIFTITGCGAVMYDSNLSEKYFLKAMHLIPDLLNKKLSENEYIFFADGVNRLSMFLSALGELSKARYYNDLAFKIVNKYALTVAFESGIYENILWCSTAFYLSPELLISSIEWSLSRNRYTSSCFFLFLYIVTLITPRVVQYVMHGDSFIQICPMEKKNIPTALSLLNQLLESIKIEGFHKVTDGKRTYESLIYNGLLSLKAWILGDYDQASSLVTQTIYQINLLKAKSLPFFAYIPVYFASFVAYQLQFLEESKIDECEICLTAALKIPETRWLKFLIDYISLGYDFPNIESTGKKWNQSLHLFKAHSIINETLLLLDSKIVQ